MLKDILLSSLITIAALYQILITKDLWLLSLITIATLWHIWWLAMVLSGIGLLLRSWWMVSEPDALWFEEFVGYQYQGIKRSRTQEWERSRIFRALGLTTLGAICLLLGIARFITSTN